MFINVDSENNEITYTSISGENNAMYCMKNGQRTKVFSKHMIRIFEG